MTKQEKLDLLKEKVECCNKCEEPVQCRIKIVFGEGNPNTRIVFLGEAPGASESEQGRPFVGRSGQLLTTLLASVGIQREDVYILNILKCRPPENRKPKPEEAAACRPFLDMQLKIIQPEIIVCLGASAANCLLDEKIPIGQMRGKWYEYNGAKVVCTFHPSYALRTGEFAKKEIKNDLEKVVAWIVENPKPKFTNQDCVV